MSHYCGFNGVETSLGKSGTSLVLGMFPYASLGMEDVSLGQGCVYLRRLLLKKDIPTIVLPGDTIYGKRQLYFSKAYQI